MSSYVELPIGIGLIPCDTLIEDRLTGKKSLIGVIGAIRVTKFPCVYPAFHLLVSLTSGNGSYPCTLQLVSESKNEVIFSGNGTLKFNNPTQVVDLVFLLQRLHFNYPDTYWIKFLIGRGAIPLVKTRFRALPPPRDSIYSRQAKKLSSSCYRCSGSLLVPGELIWGMRQISSPCPPGSSRKSRNSPVSSYLKRNPSGNPPPVRTPSTTPPAPLQ